MADGSIIEQWLVHAINQLRLDPAGTAARFGIDLNDGLPPGTLSAIPLKPIALSDLLYLTASFHSDWQLNNDAFGTTGLYDSTPGDRINFAGYDPDATWSWGEITNWKGMPAGINPDYISFETLIANILYELVHDPDLRAMLLTPEWNQIGASLVHGDGYIQDGQNWYGAITTIDLVADAAKRFITGNIWSGFVESQPTPFTTVGANVVGTDDSDQTGLGGGYSILATSDHQVVQIGGARISLDMPDGNVEVDLLNGLLVEASWTFTLLSAGYNARLLGVVDADLFAAESAGGTWINGNAGTNRIVGNSHNNKLDGGAGLDRLIGGRGDDLYYVHGLGTEYTDSSNDAVIEATLGGYDTIIARYNYVLTAGSEVEHIQTYADIFWDVIDLTGNKLSQRITGNYGQNRLDGGGGGDILDGLDGNDTYVIRDADDIIIEADGRGLDRVLAAVSYRLQADDSIETLATISPSAATAIDLRGNAFNQHIIGNAAGNRLEGREGHDSLDGRGGADSLYGGYGDDIFIVDHAGDRVYEYLDQGTDHVKSSVSFSLSGQHLELLTLTGTADIDGTGNGLRNTISGNAGDNVLDGGGNVDMMYGRGGSDTYIIESTGDRAFESAGQAGTDAVISSVSYSIAGQHIENLTLTGASNIKATGNELDNVITGNGVGNTIDGGLGADTLIGGGGWDRFVFSTALGAGNVDTILDFVSGADSIGLSTAIFAEVGSALSAAEFKELSTGPVDSSDRILFDAGTGEIFYDSDGSGAAAAIRFAVLEGGAVIDNTDFILL